jgi:hypothetical protein
MGLFYTRRKIQPSDRIAGSALRRLRFAATLGSRRYGSGSPISPATVRPHVHSGPAGTCKDGRAFAGTSLHVHLRSWGVVTVS